MKSSVKTNVPSPEDTVSYTAPLLGGEARQDILLAVNGEIVRIRRGETVQIKRKFLEALENAQKQTLSAHRAMALAQQRSDTALAAM